MKLKKGFTLIELLVVIAILAILVAIVTIAYRAKHLNAVAATHNSNVRTLQDVGSLYIAEHSLPSDDKKFGCDASFDFEESEISGYLQSWPVLNREIKNLDEGKKHADSYCLTIYTDGKVTVEPPMVDDKCTYFIGN